MSGLVIVGGGGLGRETLTVTRELGCYDRVVVLDEDPATWGRPLGGATVAGGLDLVRHHRDHDVVVAVRSSDARLGIVRRLAAHGVRTGRYARIIHPSVDVPESCTVGPGCILLAHVALTSGVTIGAHVVVMPNVTLTHDDVIDDFVTICARVSLGGDVHVGRAAHLGMNSSVRERVTVGPHSVLGMGSTLLRDLPADETWAGVPARSLVWMRARRLGP